MAGSLLVAEPFVAGALATTQPANTGAATLTLSLPSLNITDLVGGNRAASLGSVALSAQSYPSLGSSLSLANLSALGQAVPGQTIMSSNSTRSGSVTVPVSAGPVAGSVGLVNYLVQSGNGAATAQLGGLNGTLSVAPLGVGASLGQQGLKTSVSPSGSSSSIVLTSPGLSLNLGNLLPANVLNGLPLTDLISLAQSLGLQLSSAITGGISQLQAVASTVRSLNGNLTNLSSAQTQLAALQAANTAVAAAQQQVTTAQQTLTSAQSKLAADQAALTTAQGAANAACSLPLPLPTCPSLQTAVTTATTVVTSDQTAVAAAQTALSTAQAA
ncbi:MAG TPA: hypothetical protein VGR90_01835, partial [Acidimicrobiales bacterium]|nr:hypothetical protein [Acidimicrobiales bacterium]